MLARASCQTEPVTDGDLPAVDAIAAALSLERRDLSASVGRLLALLETTLPADLVEVTREKAGGLTRRLRGGGDPPQVLALSVRLGDQVFTLHRGKDRTPPRAEIVKVVRGITLSRSEPGLDAWTRALAAALAESAGQDAATRGALDALLDPSRPLELPDDV